MEEVRAVVLIESDSGWRCEDIAGNPHELPDGVTPRHLAALMALMGHGNAVPLLRVVPPATLPCVSAPTGIEPTGQD